MVSKLGGRRARMLSLACAAAALGFVGAVRAEAGAPVVLGFGPPVTVTFPPPIYIPAPLPSTAPPGVVVRPPAPLPPLVLRVQPPVAFPAARHDENGRPKPRR
jgi:hypothetical protein